MKKKNECHWILWNAIENLDAISHLGNFYDWKMLGVFSNEDVIWHRVPFTRCHRIELFSRCSLCLCTVFAFRCNAPIGSRWTLSAWKLSFNVELNCGAGEKYFNSWPGKIEVVLDDMESGRHQRCHPIDLHSTALLTYRHTDLNAIKLQYGHLSCCGCCCFSYFRLIWFANYCNLI